MSLMSRGNNALWQFEHHLVGGYVRYISPHIIIIIIKKGDNSLQTWQVYDRKVLLVITLSEVHFPL